jgi:hypothetical protein
MGNGWKLLGKRQFHNNNKMGDAEEDHGLGEGNRQLGCRALHAHGEQVQGGLFIGPVPAAPLVHVGNFKERDPPIFRGLPHEDVMEL